MKNVIHIYGASGSGTSTLGRKISEELGYKFMDTDDYFWLPTNPQYTTKRSKEERLALMKKDISENENVVISGSLADWGDELIPLFTLAIRLVTDTEIRIERLKAREKQKFGDRIMPGGDMYGIHMDFIEWTRKYDTGSVNMRSKAKHDEWQKLLQCKQIVLDGADDLEENFGKVQAEINSVIGRTVTVTVDRPLGSYHLEHKDMLEVNFYDTVDDAFLKFAVIISQSNGKWVFCKHKERDTYEVPGGHREAGEDIFETAKRELQEETGAIKFDIKPLCVYSVTGKTRVNETGEESFGLLCFAEIKEFSDKLDSEMEKVVLMDELPEDWTYPLIQPKLIERYLQIERHLYSHIQLVAKKTIKYIRSIIKPGINLLQIRKLCEEKILEFGADSFWYWDVGAFVFAGDETTVSVSGKQYVTSDRVIGNNDIITIDLSPQAGNIWGDYARTIVIEDGKVVDDIEQIENTEWKSGLQMEEKLHSELLCFATKETTFEELYYHMNEFIVKNGFVNLDFMGNLGHSIVKTKGDRVYIEKGNTKKLGDVKYFTFEPHIAFPDSKYGYKKENIYYFDGDRLVEL